MRQLTLTTAPAASILSIDEAREHLRVTSAAEDATIALYMAAAETRLDGRDGILGRALVSQSWEMELPCFPFPTRSNPLALIRLPLPPFQSVSSFEYNDTAGDTHTIEADAYLVRMDKGQALLEPLSGWPGDAEAVRIVFACGYGDEAGDVPAPIRAAALLILTALYENRGDALDVGAKGTVARLVAPYRVPV